MKVNLLSKMANHRLLWAANFLPERFLIAAIFITAGDGRLYTLVWRGPDESCCSYPPTLYPCWIVRARDVVLHDLTPVPLQTSSALIAASAEHGEKP